MVTEILWIISLFATIVTAVLGTSADDPLTKAAFFSNFIVTLLLLIVVDRNDKKK